MFKPGKHVLATLQAFIRQYQGGRPVGDNLANHGQCVGLVELWIDALKLPHIWGNAADLPFNLDSKYYRYIVNEPTNYPSPGDIVVWGRTWGSGYGHTGVCVTGTVMDMTILQQNDPVASPPHLKVYGYTGVMGWIHPIVKS